jgi:hypothetical protein
LGGDLQVGCCGSGGRGFDTRGCFLLGLPSSRLRGCCRFGLRHLRPGRLPGGCHFRLFGCLRDRVRRGIWICSGVVVASTTCLRQIPAQRLGPLLKSRSGLSIRNGVLLYKQLILPVMDYACPVWRSAVSLPYQETAGASVQVSLHCYQFTLVNW